MCVLLGISLTSCSDTCLTPVCATQPQMMGQLDGFADDDASIDEDTNSDGGAVSRAGDDFGGRMVSFE